MHLYQTKPQIWNGTLRNIPHAAAWFQLTNTMGGLIRHHVGCVLTQVLRFHVVKYVNIV